MSGTEFPDLDRAEWEGKMAREAAEDRAEIKALRAALESIATNTCCDKCQEAALVAKAALSGHHG